MTRKLRVAGVFSLAALLTAVLLIRPGAEAVVNAAQPPATELPADLALVPADAVGFLHIRGVDLWKHEAMAGFREVWEKAGPKAHAALDAQIVPKISTFERATGFLLLDARQEPMPFLVLRFTAPFDPAEVAKTYLADPTRAIVGGKFIYSAAKGSEFELGFPDRQHIVIGLNGTLTGLFSKSPARSGPLSYGLQLAAGGKPVVVSVNVAAIPPEAFRELKDLPTEVLPLLKAEHVTAALDLAGAVKVDLRAGYKTAADAQDAEKAVKTLAELGRKHLTEIKEDIEKRLYDPKAKTPRPLEGIPEAVFTVFALGAINKTDELLANPGAHIKRAGNDLTASFSLPKELVVGASGMAAFGVGLLLPAIQKTRAAAARMQSQNNLKQIALAVHNYESAYGHLPNNVTDKNGKPILSWRVAILPFIEQDNVYRNFKLDEPWDSEHNKKFSQLAIKVFMSPQADPATPPGMTSYKAFVGPDTMFSPGKKIRFQDISDGTSNTIMVIEAGDPVPWAKPDDIPFDPKKPLPKLALPGVPDIVNAAFGDGSVRTLVMKGIKEDTMKALITRSGGEVLPPE